MEKLQQLLNSSDIEMIRLGAEVVKNTYPQDEWESIIHDNVPFFRYIITIKDNDIVIDEFGFGIIDAWAMRRKVDTPLIEITKTTI